MFGGYKGTTGVRKGRYHAHGCKRTGLVAGYWHVEGLVTGVTGKQSGVTG